MAATSASVGGERIDLNRASIDVLAGLEGIDRALAARIVRHRNERGFYASVGQLADVSGVGRELVERLRAVLYASGDGEDPAQEADGEGTEGVRAAEPVTRSPHAALPEAEDASAPDAEPPEPTTEDALPEAQAAEIAAPAPHAGAPKEGTGRTIKLPGTVQPVSEEPIEMGAPAMATAASAGVSAASTEVAAEDALADLRPDAAATGAGAGRPTEGEATAARTPGSLARERAIVREHVRSRESPRGVWRIALPALIGGVVGAALTLLVVGLWFAAFDVVRRPEMQAISANLDTVARNTEVIWARVDDLSASLGGLQQDVTTLDAELAALDGGVQAAVESIDELDARTTGLDERLQSAREALTNLDNSVSEMQATVDAVDARIAEFNAFFTGLRELLQGFAE